MMTSTAAERAQDPHTHPLPRPGLHLGPLPIGLVAPHSPGGSFLHLVPLTTVLDSASPPLTVPLPTVMAQTPSPVGGEPRHLDALWGLC